MKIKDFEKQIQKDIDPNLNIRINPNHSDIAGVYWNDIYIGVAVPPLEIHEEVNVNITDAIGQPYKTIQMALDFIEGKLPKYKKEFEEDPDLFKKDK